MADIFYEIQSIWYTFRDHYSGSYTRRIVEEAVALLGTSGHTSSPAF